MPWLINDWFPKGNRGIDAAPEGGCKTTFGCWWSVCIAAGTDIFGHKVDQGQVLIIDEETPKGVLEKTLDRFSQGLGYQSHLELPINTLSMEGFKIGRKSHDIMEMVNLLQPVFIRLDSYISMLPGGRQGLSENNSESGIATRDALNEMIALSKDCNTLLAAHSGAPVLGWSLEEIGKHDMNDLVRGHKSIVGEACDTGFILKKLSQYPEPLRFAIQTRARRGAVPMSAQTVYVEMVEESYGEGWARLVQIKPVPAPPSKLAKELFKFFLDKNPHTWQDISRQSSLYTRKQNQEALQELEDNRVILTDQKPFTYHLNSKYKTECESEYLGKLK